MHIKFPTETSKQLGSSLGSTWFHLVPKFGDFQQRLANSLVPSLVPLGSEIL